MGIVFSIILFVVFGVFVFKQINADGTGKKIGRYLIYIILLIIFLFVYFIIKT